MRGFMMRRLAFVTFALLAAGCSGGGTSAVPAVTSSAPASGAPASTASANAQVQITIPAPPSTTSARRVLYVSPATQSLAFAPVNGTPVVVPLTPTSPGCTSSGGATTCTVNVPLPVGANQQFVVSTFASTNGSGTALSATKITQSIVSGQSNPIALTLGGIPKTLTLGVPTTPIPTVAATSIPVTVTVKDASGNTIIGNAPFSDANGNAVSIAMTNSDTTGATTVTPAALTAPGSAAVAYDSYFQPTSTTITAGGPGLTSVSANLLFAPKIISLAFTGTDPLTLIAHSGIESVSPRRHAAVTTRRRPLFFEDTNGFAALLPTGNAGAPYSLGANETISGAGFDEFCSCGSNYGAATAATGHLYFTESSATDSGFFDAGTTPTWPPITAMIAGTPTQQYSVMALGPGGKMYAANVGGFVQINPVTGAVIGAPVTTSAAQFQQFLPNAIAVGPDGTVYIELYAAGGNDEVLAFTPAGSSFSFSRAFWTANSHTPSDGIFGLYVDAANKMYISADSFGTVDIVPASSSGLQLPLMVISDDIQLQSGAQVVVDRAGNVIWTTVITASVYAPNSGSVPPPGHDPNIPWGPPTDTPALQTVTSNSDNISVLTFGPGS